MRGDQGAPDSRTLLTSPLHLWLSTSGSPPGDSDILEPQVQPNIRKQSGREAPLLPPMSETIEKLGMVKGKP